MKQVTVTKGYSQTISQDYNSYKFSVSLTETFEVANDEELNQKSAELFQKCINMVNADIANVFGGRK
jgi:hypothetical protein